VSQLKITKVECKNALVKSGIDGVDYALNPYTGCQHGCVYCYAEFMKKYTNHNEQWGEFVDVKINVVERLRDQIKKTKPGMVMIGTVTDAYQPLEGKFQLTRKCLEILTDFDFPVFIQTKSDLILRDLDVLKKIKDKEIGFTITCVDPEVERMFEPDASDLGRRFEALKKLKDNRIPTFAFVGPILPFFSDHENSLKLLFEKLQKLKIKKVYLDKMNYLKGKRKRISALLEKRFPHALRFYEGMVNHEERYSEWLKSNLASALSKFSFEAEVLF
jgi:DNA repair photolyase